ATCAASWRRSPRRASRGGRPPAEAAGLGFSSAPGPEVPTGPGTARRRRSAETGPVAVSEINGGAREGGSSAGPPRLGSRTVHSHAPPVPARGPLHALRAAVLAAACVGIAWCGHAVWGGAPTAPWAPLLAGAALWPPLSRFTRARREFGEIFAVLAAAQVPLHLLLTWGAPAPESAVAAGPHAAHALGYHPAMLAGGEAALWSLVGLVSAALPRLLVPLRGASPPVPPRPPSPVASAPPGPELLGADRPRGPPALAR